MSTSAPDQPRQRRVRRLTTENRYGLVLALLLVTYLVSVAADGSVAAGVVVLIQLVTVWLAFTVSEARRTRAVVGVAIGLVLATAVVGAAAGYTVDGSTGITGLVYSVNAVLYLIAPVLLIVHIGRRNTVDLQSFLGAISAYVMLGMMFAFSYRALGELQAGPFFGTSGDGSTADDLFFSFITLTTTGYGNLVPAENPGQSLAVLEAIVGQLFLLTAVAKVVASWDPRASRAARAAAEAAGEERNGDDGAAGRVGA